MNDNTDERGGLPSASKFERLAACPGSRRLQDAIPEPTPEPEDKPQEKDPIEEMAERGTRIHKARETGSTLELDPEESALYQAGLKYEEELVQKWMWTLSMESCDEGPREERLWLHDPRTLEPLVSGKLDVHFFSPDKRFALVIDWKTGFCQGLTGPSGNWQLRLQALLLKEEHPELEQIRVAFCKPRQFSGDADFCDYTEQDLKMTYDSVVYTLWWSTQPDAQRVPGPQCRYCPCKPYCPEAAAYALLPIVMAKSVPRSEEMAWDQMPDLLQPEDLYKLWECAPIITKILMAVYARLKGMPAEELAKIGLCLGKGRKLDPITGIVEAFKFLSGHFGEEPVYACMEFGKGKLTDLVMEQRNLEKSEASTWLDNQLDEWITRKTSEPPLKKLKE